MIARAFAAAGLLLGILVLTMAVLAADCPRGSICHSPAVQAEAIRIAGAACPRCDRAEITKAVVGMDIVRGPHDNAKELACASILHLSGDTDQFLRDCYGRAR